jgi:branched-chain amino acid transport system substrate-binding protein
MKAIGRRHLGAFICAASLIAAACSSGGGTTADGTVLAQGQQDAVASAIGNSTTVTEGPSGGSTTAAKITSMSDWAALWAKQRAAVVKLIKDNGWGWDQAAKKVTGPGGFSVDLSACPAGWDPYQGLSKGEITLGQNLAGSGPLADYGNIGVGQTVYYNYINSQGGITDAEGKTYRIVNDVRDDSYDPAKTVPIIDELLDSEGSFAIETAGSPHTLKVYDKLNARCVPDPFVLSGHPAWGDPENHPWVWGEILAYTTEAILWGGLIEKKFAGQAEVNVGALVIQNDFGKAYELGFAEFLKTSKVKVNFDIERFDPTAPTVTNQMTTLASKNLDVLIVMTAGSSCTQAITEAANNGMKNTVDLMFQPSVCKAKSFVGKDAVGGDGSASNGWWIVGGGVKDFTDPSYSSDPWVAFVLDLLKGSGHPITDSSSLGSGFIYAWPMVEALKIAAELPGGVSRPNLMIAARTMDMTNPNLLDGISYKMSGNDDAYLTEGTEFAVYDSAKQSWVIQQDLGLIELGGKSSNCAWDPSGSSCK